MARFDIISKDGSIVRYSGKPRYIGTYLKSSHLEFNEIASPTPIEWEVGDYVDYPRTGMRYYLYSIPQPTKKARKNTHGGAFVYSGVLFHAATKELEIAPFRDLVPNDNGIHFSTAPDVATFENVEGIARRIQACMDDLYPDRWEIRIADFDAALDAEIIEKISQAKDFALSGGTCLDALSKIYELWQEIGWIHSYENGKEVITIGYANKRIDANTTDAFLYGKGNGLTAIKRNQTNKDEFATRLYVYGSERNLISRYYNGLDILNAESVDIRNLMLPLDVWGKTDGLPDARKAYLENAEAVAKYGVIPKTHYFDSPDSGADIYPSIEGMTVGQIRTVLADMGQAEYSPNTEIYPDDSERVDEVLSVVNPADNGVLKEDGKAYEEVHQLDISGSGEWPISSETWTKGFLLAETAFAKSGYGEVSISPDMNIIVIGSNLKSVAIRFKLGEMSDSVTASKTAIGKQPETDDTSWSVEIPSLSIKADRSVNFPVYLTMDVTITTEDTTERDVKIVMPSGALEVKYSRLLTPTFSITLKQLGFDIDKQATLGEGKVISMKTGACAGRNFEIATCAYQSDTDSWKLTCKRQQDDTLGMLFPYADYPIAKGDRFVLLEIAMPVSYIRVAMERLLAEGQKLLARASKIQSNYEPSVDAKVMLESERTLREGMYMEISDDDVVDNGTEYILIDTLNIYEDESAVPTYKVTLRERRKVTYKGTPSATSTTSTKSVDTGESGTTDVNLSGYAKETYVDEKVKTVSDLLASMWYFDSDGNLVTDKQVKMNSNLIVVGDTATGGTGEDTPSTGGGIDEAELAEYLSDNNYVNSVATLAAVLGYTPVNPSSLATVATSGSYNDLSNRPTSMKSPYALTINNSAGTAQVSYDGSATKSLTLTKSMVGLGNVANSTYAGGTAVTLNGTSKASATASFYAPTSAGTSGQLLVSTGGAPSWVSKSSISLSAFTDDVVAGRYLPLSGGTMTGTLTIKNGNDTKLVLDNTDGEKCLIISFRESATEYGSLRMSADGCYINGSMAITASNGIRQVSFDGDEPTLNTFGLWNNVGPFISFGKSSYNMGFRYAGSNTLQSRVVFGSTTADWKTIAFTDSDITGNAATATKLQTTRTLWGQSFNGSAAVTGSLSSVGSITFSADSSYDIGSSSVQARYVYASWVGAKTGGIFQIGANNSYGITLNTSNNVTIGSSDLAGTSVKLYVAGASAFVNNRVIIPVNGDRITFNAASGYTMGILAMNTGNTYLEAPLATDNSSGAKTPIMIGWRDGTYPFFISTSANVGIGTTSPAYKLDVAGTGRFTGAVTLNSTLAVSGQTTISNNLIVSGDTATGSDIRFKDIIEDKTIDLMAMAGAPLFTFTWNDREDGSVHMGTSAQYWERVTPWLVKGEDFKHLDYATLGVAMAVSLAKKTVNIEERVKVLERENESLKEELRRIRNGAVC